jgi:hypothetical protein
VQQNNQVKIFGTSWWMVEGGWCENMLCHAPDFVLSPSQLEINQIFCHPVTLNLFLALFPDTKYHKGNCVGQMWLLYLHSHAANQGEQIGRIFAY